MWRNPSTLLSPSVHMRLVGFVVQYEAEKHCAGSLTSRLIVDTLLIIIYTIIYSVLVWVLEWE